MRRLFMVCMSAVIPIGAIAQEEDGKKSSLHSSIESLSESRVSLADRFASPDKNPAHNLSNDPMRILDGKIDHLYKQSLKQETLRQKIFQILPRLFPRPKQLDPSDRSNVTDVDPVPPEPGEQLPPLPEAPTEQEIPENPEVDGAPPTLLHQERPPIDYSNSPVDLLGSGDNFYLHGNYSLAGEMYNRVQTATLSDDQKLWLMFQKANCLRQTEETEDAKTLYREVGLTKGAAEHITRSAKWWLQHIEELNTVDGELQSLRNGNRILRKQINELKP